MAKPLDAYELSKLAAVTQSIRGLNAESKFKI